MGAELDMSQYLDLFLQEAEEQLETLEQETLKLEEDPTAERLQAIFRAAHTLKGSSRAMGYSNLAQLTHEMENVLDHLRNGKLEVNTQIADLLLACIDTLGQMTESIGQGNGDTVQCSNLVVELQAFLSTADGMVVPKPVASAESFQSKLRSDQVEELKAAAIDGPVYHAKLRLRSDTVMKFARAFMAMNTVQSQGTLLLCVPDRTHLEDEEFDREFEMFYHSDVSPEAITATLSEIGEMEWCEVTTWTGELPTEGTTEAKVIGAPPGQPNLVLETGSADAALVDAKGMPVQKKGETGQTVRVDVGRLDTLMNLVGELVIDRTRIAQIGSELTLKYRDENVDALGETVSHIARITSDLQDQIMKARMMPIETVFNRFPRVIRDLAQKLGKDVKIDIFGGETELDRSVIEVIGDPLLHILRNSVDHGIEMPEEREAAGKPKQGRIVVSAKHQENHIVIEIADDGKGIDVATVRRKAAEKGLMSADAAERMTDKEAMQMIFASGLSTAQVVSEVSGRGVGMDIVKSNIQKLGGIIDLESAVGEGTRTQLRLPLTLAIIRGLLVRSCGNVYVVPLGSVIETLLADKKEIQYVSRHEVIVIRGMTTPLLRMREFFQTRKNVAGNANQVFVVVVGLAEQRVGIVVDDLIGEQEVVIKSLSRFCGDVPGVSGATILGDGNVALIVDVNGIIGV